MPHVRISLQPYSFMSCMIVLSVSCRDRGQRTYTLSVKVVLLEERAWLVHGLMKSGRSKNCFHVNNVSRARTSIINLQLCSHLDHYKRLIQLWSCKRAYVAVKDQSHTRKYCMAKNVYDTNSVFVSSNASYCLLKGSEFPGCKNNYFFKEPNTFIVSLKSPYKQKRLFSCLFL